MKRPLRRHASQDARDRQAASAAAARSEAAAAVGKTDAAMEAPPAAPPPEPSTPKRRARKQPVEQLTLEQPADQPAPAGPSDLFERAVEMITSARAAELLAAARPGVLPLQEPSELLPVEELAPEPATPEQPHHEPSVPVPPAVPSIEEQLTPSKYGARQPGAGAPATELPAARPAGRRAATPATEPPAATAGSGKRTPRSRAAATTAAPAVPDAEAPAEAAPAGPIVRSAVAKLNLTLAVLHRRKDGYHALHSVMVPLALCDVLTVSVAVDRARAAGRDTLESAGFDAGAPADNLVLQAIAQTRAAVAETWPGAPEVPPPLNVRLEKKIPVAAGLGGGSSDAACAMDAALEAWDCGLTYQQAIWITATLGSDAPFFLAGGAALVTGRGEMVEPLPDLSGKPPAILLVTPCLRVSTTQVFEAYARGARPPFAGAARAVSEGLAESMRRGLSSQELIDHAADLAAANDLMLASVVVAPPLMAFRRSLARLLGHPLGQSGSGPTAWSLYSNVTEARKAATEVVRAYRAGALPEIGEGEPFVAVTTMLLRGDGRHAADHSPQGA